MVIDNSNADTLGIGESFTGGYADAIRINTSRCVTFDAPATYTVFDYVCEHCGWHSADHVSICPLCGGVVVWHDDVLAVRDLSQPLLQKDAIERLDRIGVLSNSYNSDGTPWVGINIQKSILFTWSGLWQNRERIDTDYCCLNTRLMKLEAKFCQQK